MRNNPQLPNFLGKIYIVATPIGNLGDITQRAIETLQNVDLILAEDTRHSKHLLSKLGIQKSMRSLHDHNEREEAEKLCEEVLKGKNLALISDAGTPLISDPGYPLVRTAQDKGIEVIPIPGPSSVIAALSASGLPTDQFTFLGFLPPKTQARRNRLEALKFEERTLIFFETPHRILESLSDMVSVFGEEREGAIARELTKTFETIRRDSLINLYKWINEDQNQTRGEMVVLISGKQKLSSEISSKSDKLSSETNELLNNKWSQMEITRMLKIVLEELPPKKASNVVAKIAGISKKMVYDLAVSFKKG